MSRSFWAKTVATAVIFAGSAVASPTASLATAPIPTQTFTAAAAFAAARQSGQPVEVLARKSATTRVWALPNGSSRARGHRGAGAAEARRPMARLRHDAAAASRRDGRAPGASGRPGVLPGRPAAGEHDLATVTWYGERIGLGWRARCPSRCCSGAKATYPEVMPGVDLVLGGAQRWLRTVLHRQGPRGRGPGGRAAAAHARRAAHVRRRRRRRRASGSAPTGRWWPRMPQAMMWDAQGRGSATGSPGARPSRCRRLTVRERPGPRLSPDLAWLNDPATQYPVTIDPGIVRGTRGRLRRVRAEHHQRLGQPEPRTCFKLGYSDDSDLRRGSSSQKCRARSYLRFDGLSRLPRREDLLGAGCTCGRTIPGPAPRSAGAPRAPTRSAARCSGAASRPGRRPCAVSTETKGSSGSCDDGWVSTDVGADRAGRLRNGWDSASMVIHAVGDNGVPAGR